MLEAQSVTVKYGNSQIIRNVSFALGAGEILAIVGANGAGKTTLLRSLNGALPLSKGEILLDGKSLKNYSRRDVSKKIAVVAQETETKFPVTVLEFVLSGRFAHGGIFGWETPEDLRIAGNALQLCDLEDYESRLMNELSGGERQRVVLARALATEAKILLLDEPTANLDPAHQALVFKTVRDRCQSENYAAVVITHDLNLAASFADEMLLLKNGAVVAQGATEEILTAENLVEIFGVKVLLDENPVSKKRRVTTVY